MEVNQPPQPLTHRAAHDQGPGTLRQLQIGSQTGAWFAPAHRARSEGIVSVLPCLQASRWALTSKLP
eukprot:369948-Prorocentrum_minimum.AAC.1